MFAEVIPISASLGTETLTYSVRDSFRLQINTGQFVKIPYGKREITGIIAHLTEEFVFSTTEIKPILEIISPIPLLAPYQIQSILAISQKHLLPIHRVCNIFLSSRLLQRLEKFHFPLKTFTKTKNSIENDIFLTKNQIITPELLFPFFKKNIVIILPDDILLKKFYDFIDKNPKKPTQNILFYWNDSTETRHLQNWIDIKNKKYEIIIGTRRLLQYNLSEYSEIWYIEDSFSIDYFHYPIRIEYNDFLAYAQDSSAFSIKIFTSIPRLKTLSQFHFFQLHHL